MTAPKTAHYEGGRLVSEWRWEARTVHGGWRVAKARWFLNKAEDWDEEFEWEHEAPFEDEAQALAVAAAFNRGAAGDVVFWL